MHAVQFEVARYDGKTMTRLSGILLAILLPSAALAAEVLLGAAAPLDGIDGAHTADVTQARVWSLPVTTPVQIAPAGNTVCTAWQGLREGRELCVRHYRLWGEVTQSFRVDGTPDGSHYWEPVAQPP